MKRKKYPRPESLSKRVDKRTDLALLYNPIDTFNLS